MISSLVTFVLDGNLAVLLKYREGERQSHIPNHNYHMSFILLFNITLL